MHSMAYYSGVSRICAQVTQIAVGNSLRHAWHGLLTTPTHYSGPSLIRTAWDQSLFRLVKFRISETIHFELGAISFLFTAHQNYH